MAAPSSLGVTVSARGAVDASVPIRLNPRSDLFSAPLPDIPNPFRHTVFLDGQYALTDDCDRAAIAASRREETPYTSILTLSRRLPHGYSPAQRQRIQPANDAQFSARTESPALSLDLRCGPRGVEAVHLYPSSVQLREFQTPDGIPRNHPSYRKGQDTDRRPTRVYTPAWAERELTGALSGTAITLKDAAHGAGTLILASAGIAAPYWVPGNDKGKRGEFTPEYVPGAISPWLFANRKNAHAQHVALHQLLTLVNDTAPLSVDAVADVCDYLNQHGRSERRRRVA